MPRGKTSERNERTSKTRKKVQSSPFIPSEISPEYTCSGGCNWDHVRHFFKNGYGLSVIHRTTQDDKAKSCALSCANGYEILLVEPLGCDGLDCDTEGGDTLPDGSPSWCCWQHSGFDVIRGLTEAEVSNAIKSVSDLPVGAIIIKLEREQMVHAAIGSAIDELDVWETGVLEV